jgi:hypothetical protein
LARQAADVRDGEAVPGGLVYSKPALRLYGSVGQLTQAGTGLNSEIMSNGMGMGSNSPKKRT